MISAGFECIDAKKIAVLLEKPDELSRFFLASEIEYCASYKDRDVRMAGCLAAKFAFIKASSFFKPPDINKIRIIHTRSGKPSVIVDKKYLEEYSISVSISHTRSVAVALCVISKNGKLPSTPKKKRYA
ncbi:MAG: 4'-phosphopantetheinyl transferase superfamily protein [Candidatus Omnitrophica bacterium]|nr:4'-phosphopantetheinyl transferase superfamily protein [Candidatus Omnitrophota bacterium]MCM8824659.1 4'-phosphopantetheinyl transferase superfamily protein [Candidatus Omnitrophota bacterium]